LRRRIFGHLGHFNGAFSNREEIEGNREKGKQANHIKQHNAEITSNRAESQAFWVLFSDFIGLFLAHCSQNLRGN